MSKLTVRHFLLVVNCDILKNACLIRYQSETSFHEHIFTNTFQNINNFNVQSHKHWLELIHMFNDYLPRPIAHWGGGGMRYNRRSRRPVVAICVGANYTSTSGGLHEIGFTTVCLAGEKPRAIYLATNYYWIPYFSRLQERGLLDNTCYMRRDYCRFRAKITTI